MEVKLDPPRDSSRKFILAERFRSFSFAFTGLATLVRTEHNARLHMVATLAVIILGFAFHLSVNEWLWLILAICWVWFAEAINSAIERLADAVTLERNPQIGAAKDIAAAAVLISSIAALIIGVLIFAPHIMRTWR